MSERKINPQVAEFVARLGMLDAGERARLKRSAGMALAESRNVLGLFYRLLPYGVPGYQEESYFLVATLFPLAKPGEQGDLGTALRHARSTQNSKGLDRRVEILLDSDAAQLPFRLRQAIHFLGSAEQPVNWVTLLEDLLSWNHQNRFVQKHWARSYYSE